MSPFSPDEKVQALHVLSVVRAAEALAAAIARHGGAATVGADAVRDELRSLCTEAGRLAFYESRAAARGTVRSLSSDRLVDAIDALRRAPRLSADEEEVVDMSDADIDSTFAAPSEQRRPAEARAEATDPDAFDI